MVLIGFLKVKNGKRFVLQINLIAYLLTTSLKCIAA